MFRMFSNKEIFIWKQFDILASEIVLADIKQVFVIDAFLLW